MDIITVETQYFVSSSCKSAYAHRDAKYCVFTNGKDVIFLLPYLNNSAGCVQIPYRLVI